MRSGGVLREGVWCTRASGVRIDDEVCWERWDGALPGWRGGPAWRVFGVERQGGVVVLQLARRDQLETQEKRIAADHYIELDSRAVVEKAPKKEPKRKKGQQNLF